MKLDEQPMKAFPHSRPVMSGQWCGMDLRDYFAAKAMQAIINLKDSSMTLPQDVAEIAYIFAEQMMTERNKK